MTPDGWFPDTLTVTVLRHGGRDNWGNEEPGIEFDIDGCLLAPGTGQSSEAHDFAHTVVSGGQLLLPPGSDITAEDRVRIRDVIWEVEGDVGDWGTGGMQVALRKSRG